MSEPIRTFDDKLGALLNKYSEENRSNTPDWILAWYIRACLDAFNRTVREREAWYGRIDNGGCVLLPIEPVAEINHDAAPGGEK